MGIGKVSILFVFLLLPVVLSLDDVDKVYFQTQQEKLIAQVNAKVDSQTNRIESSVKTSFDTAKKEIQDEMSTQIKGNLRAVAVGLAGLIIITLAIFKVIDLKISSTRNIKKYETMLQQKAEELNKIILTATNERNELALFRQQLTEYQRHLQSWDKQLQGQGVPPSPQFQKKPEPSYTLISPPEKQPLSNWKKGLIILIVVGVVAIIGGVIYYLAIT